MIWLPGVSFLFGSVVLRVLCIRAVVADIIKSKTILHPQLYCGLKVEDIVHYYYLIILILLNNFITIGFKMAMIPYPAHAL